MSGAASEDLDRPVRLAAFEFLAEQTRLYGETLRGRACFRASSSRVAGSRS